MGIGFQNLEASVLDIGGMGQYKGMLQHMVDQGLINTRSYSLWLDDLSTSYILAAAIYTSRNTHHQCTSLSSSQDIMIPLHLQSLPSNPILTLPFPLSSPPPTYFSVQPYML